MDSRSDRQLGDFIKGRFLFIESYCQKNGLDYARTRDAVKAEALRLAALPERVRFLDEAVFGAGVLSSAHLPDWVDAVFLEAMTVALKGPGAPLFTTTSRFPCITFEAGRFNAHRQSETVFRAYFTGKKPGDWLLHTFHNIYRQCYGEEAAQKFTAEEISPGHGLVTLDNRGLAKSGKMDCSTTVGYLYGSMEKLGATDILVTHHTCGAGSSVSPILCVFEVTWK